MKKSSSNSKLRSGAALMLALWALFLLSAMIISWALDINSRLAVSGNASRVLDAEAMASSGADVALAEVALRPNTAPGSPNLHRQMGDRQGYDVQMIGECGRLDLNWLIREDDQIQAKLEVLRQYLTNKGVEYADTDVMIDSLRGWVSQNRGLHLLNECPETDEYRPPHSGRLDSVDELKKVCGWAEFTSRSGWDKDFTVFPQGCNGIDLGWASRDVLLALSAILPGMSPDRVDRFLQLRQGPDGIDGTADDGFQLAATGASGGSFGIPVEALNVLGLRQDQLPQIGVPLRFRGDPAIFRIVSAGKSGDVTRTVQMVVQKQTGLGTTTVFSWKEL